MDPRSFLKVTILLMLIPALICLFLPPGTIANSYTTIMHPLALLIGALLSLRVASIYKSWLRRAFIFLSLFLFFMMLANIDPLMEILRAVFGDLLFPLFVLIMQWTTYAMLVISSICILKVTELREISTGGRIAITAVCFLGILIVTYHIPSLIEEVAAFHVIYIISLLLIRLTDVAIVIMLVPVVILYAQQMRLEGRESLTFTTVICGIILSLTDAYVYEISFGVPLYVIAREVCHTGSILDALYVFSYLIIAAGLYVHKRYDEWGFDMVEQALSRG